MKSLPVRCYPRQSSRSFPLSSGWRHRQAPATATEEADFARPEFDDADWLEAVVPSTRAAVEGNDTVWYRLRFDRPTAPMPGRRTLLRFGGVFLEADAWLNGVHLGSHYGYFAPFAFDVTDHLLPNDNLLAVRARCSPEGRDLKAKKHVLGIFGEWDCKPYPNHALADPPPGRRWEVPLGLWREVTWEETGPVVVEWTRVHSQFPDADWGTARERLASGAHLRVELGLRNLVDEPREVGLSVGLTPPEGQDDPSVEETRTITLAPGETQVVSVEMAVAAPLLWWPWTHGRPYLYALSVSGTVNNVDDPTASFRLSRRIGFREVRAIWERSTAGGRWEWWLNGRRVFPRGSNYVSEFWLDRADDGRFAADLSLARAANMDTLRVHAHIEKEEFYDLADEAGFLVLCDFPLIFCYVFGASADDQAFFRQAVLDQLREMVELLHHHPSIVLWGVHNEPPWPADMFWFGEPHRAQANREVDEEGAALVARLDPSRPVIAASGEFDEHLYHGWYHSRLEDYRTLAPAFPTEFGAQALPARKSPFWRTVNAAWPVPPDDPSWRYADYQPDRWAEQGVGSTNDYPSLGAYVVAGQRYQAEYCRFAVEHWRARKFRPTGGLVHFMLVDCWPAITWSVLDYYRLPKRAYAALARAYRPTHVCLLLDGDYELRDRYRATFPAGARAAIRLVVVNDDYRVAGRATLAWRLLRVEAPAGEPAGTRWPWDGTFDFDLPGGADPAVEVARLEESLPAGRYLVFTRLWLGGRLLDRNRAEFWVDGPGVAPGAPR